MARYKWPAGRTRREKAALRSDHFERLWSNVADGLLEEARQELHALLESPVIATLTPAQVDLKRWLPIGPSVILEGQASGAPRVAGRVRDVKRSPDGTRIYAASANGGVWFSGDAGQSWAPLGGMATAPLGGVPTGPASNPQGARANALVIGCLHVDFGADQDSDTVYAGTGEPDKRYAPQGFPGGRKGGIGILKLTGSVTSALGDPAFHPWSREADLLTGAGIFRLARNPALAGELVAATTRGLYKRIPPATATSLPVWTRVSVSPFNLNTDHLLMTDAVWVPAAGPAPARLYVALVNLFKPTKVPTPGSQEDQVLAIKSAIYASKNGVSGPFTQISLPGYVEGNRIALAAAPPSTQPQIVYALSSADGIPKVKPGGPRMWRIDGTTARIVTHLPDNLFDEQSWYDMALAVDPSDPSRVFFGGSALEGLDGYNAALYRGTVVPAGGGTTHKLSLEFIGAGVHPDVHAIAVSDDGAHVWIGCDGGLFASNQKGDLETFEARNTGLAITECGYVASHPGHSGPVAAGTQDNGVIVRIGDTIWQMKWEGDGGGVLYHPKPGSEPYLVGQYIQADWSGNGSFRGPIGSAPWYKPEKKRSSFYSGAGAVASVDNKARLAIGTYRVWLTDGWEPGRAGRTIWRTLPTNTDPGGIMLNRKQDAIDPSKDSFTDKIVSVKWLDPGTVSGPTHSDSKLLVLLPRTIVSFHQTAATGPWTTRLLSERLKSITAPAVIPPNGGPVPHLPGVGAWSEIAPDGTAGSFYVSTTGLSVPDAGGIVEAVRMDTLWWYDSVAKLFHPTGLRNDPAGTKAPAFAVVCDPQIPSIVYVGTALGVWKGTFSRVTGQPPHWSWEFFSFGLPEAVVQDLSIYWNPAAPSRKLLRAALQARGVWEVDVSAAPVPAGRSFLRVHALDTRWESPTRLKDLTSETRSPPDYPKCLSPDIAIIRTPPPGWPVDPTEADLFDLEADVRSIGAFGHRFRAQRLSAALHTAYVLVHHRHSKPAPPANFRVALLKRRLTDQEMDGAGVTLSQLWRDAIPFLLNGADVSLDDLWKSAAAAESPHATANSVSVTATIRNPAAHVDARMPRAATFNLELTGAPARQRYLLLALMTSVSDPQPISSLTHTNVGDLVLSCRHACARVVYV